MKEEEVAAFWDANAVLWDELRLKGYDTYLRASFPMFKERLGSIRGRFIVDIGCGDGYNTRVFAGLGARVIGIDIAGQMVACAKKREEQNPLGIEYHVASGSDLSFLENCSVDGVVSTLAVMDMPDMPKVFSEAFRIIRPGGFFQFSVLHPVLTSGGYERVFDENGRKRGTVVTNYFRENEPKIQEWYFTATPKEERKSSPPFKMPFFHRTVSTYFSTLRKVGFTIESIDEPHATEEIIEKEPDLWDTTMVPYFLIFRCSK